MSSENPYQSPQEDSQLPPVVPVEDGRIYQERPTWRFWVLILICAPPMVGLVALTVSGVFSGIARQSGDELFGLLFSIGVLAAFVASCSLIAIYWRAPALQRAGQSGGANTGFVIAAIWMLAIIAAPPAFFYTCTPGAFLGIAAESVEGAFALGVMAGLGGVILVGVLARGLWLDADGRKPELPEAVERPLPRLQAKPPENANSPSPDANPFREGD